MGAGEIRASLYHTPKKSIFFHRAAAGNTRGAAALKISVRKDKSVKKSIELSCPKIRVDNFRLDFRVHNFIETVKFPCVLFFKKSPEKTTL